MRSRRSGSQEDVGRAARCALRRIHGRTGNPDQTDVPGPFDLGHHAGAPRGLNLASTRSALVEATLHLLRVLIERVDNPQSSTV
jgi:hypothetical protein